MFDFQIDLSDAWFPCWHLSDTSVASDIPNRFLVFLFFLVAILVFKSSIFSCVFDKEFQMTLMYDADVEMIIFSI